MVPKRDRPSATAKKGQESALVRDYKVILRGISREKSRRDLGILEYNPQQGKWMNSLWE